MIETFFGRLINWHAPICYVASFFYKNHRYIYLGLDKSITSTNVTFMLGTGDI